MSTDILRLVDSISRDKNIEKDQLLEDLEVAMASAIRKTYGETEDVEVTIDRITGAISARHDEHQVSMAELGRISAQTCKQVMIQKIREAERNSIFEEFSERVGTIVTGTVSRHEGGALIISLGRTDAILPRGEQIPGESHHPGDRVRAMILDVREAPHQVKIVLTRTHPDYIRRLFELEVPEVGERIIEIKALAREAGYRTKVAVASIDTKVDAVGACVGVRGSRIRNIVDELGGEKIDIVRWNESSQVLISNALKPAEVQEIALCFELSRVTVVVADDQLSLAIGKRGQNVRLAARLTGWDIDILTPAEYNENIDDMEQSFRDLGVDDVMLDKMLAMGMVSLMDVEEVGVDPLVAELEIEREQAERIVEKAAVEAKRVMARKEEAKKAKALLAAQTAAAIAAGETPPSADDAADDTSSDSDAAESDAAGSDAGAADGTEVDADDSASATAESAVAASESAAAADRDMGSDDDAVIASESESEPESETSSEAEATPVTEGEVAEKLE